MLHAMQLQKKTEEMQKKNALLQYSDTKSGSEL